MRDTVWKCSYARKRLCGGEAGCGLKNPEISGLNRSVNRPAYSTSPDDVGFTDKTECHFRVGDIGHRHRHTGRFHTLVLCIPNIGGP